MQSATASITSTSRFIPIPPGEKGAFRGFACFETGTTVGNWALEVKSRRAQPVAPRCAQRSMPLEESPPSHAAGSRPPHPLENGPFGGNDRDAHQDEAIFLAWATTSSMPPCM